MLRLIIRACYISFIGCLLTVLTVAQTETCPVIVQNVLDSADDICSATGRNQVCYVNLQAEITPQDPTIRIKFDQPGDLVNLDYVETMVMSPMNTQDETWGVSLMKLQANLPDTLPGQNVTMLLFGDVEIRNAVDSNNTVITLPASATTNANVRVAPSTSAGVLRALSISEAVSLDGRNIDGTWVHLVLDNNTSGWVYADLLTVEGDVMTLASVVAGEENPSRTPMQAFYFMSGIGDSACTQAPESGILIQTPSGGQKVNLTANGVEISLGSTAFLQAQLQQELIMAVVEGEGTLTSSGETVAVPAGSQSSVPLDENGNAIGIPSAPMPYDANRMNQLPVQALSEDIEVSEPMTHEALDNLTIAPPIMPSVSVPQAMMIPGLSPYCTDLINRVLEATHSTNLDTLLALETEFNNSDCEAEINRLADTSGDDESGDHGN